jgi:hypothetical protein
MILSQEFATETENQDYLHPIMRHGETQPKKPSLQGQSSEQS